MQTATLHSPKRFWLNDNFAPVFEERSDTDLKVTGTIPSCLNGKYVRNGPNPPSGASSSWFYGQGMLHAIEIENGRAKWYKNRYVKTPLFSPNDTVDAASLSLENSIANTHVISHAGKILALQELSLPVEMSPDLDTLGAYNFENKLSTAMTAHPKICGKSRELLFFSYCPFEPKMIYHRVSAFGELLQSSEISIQAPAMVHDFNITENFVIFMDLPVVWNLHEPPGAAGIPINWSDDYGARLGVMPRNGTNSDVVWYDIDPCFVWHPLNAYEQGDKIIIDVCRMEYALKIGADEPDAFLTRWEINRSTGRVSETQIDDHSTELPRVPDALVGQEYRYGYTSDFGDNFIGTAGPLTIGIRKYDMHKSESELHAFGKGRYGGEPVFVPAEHARSEDDGYVLSFVYDAAENKSELVILNAADITQKPVARIHLETRIPVGFHGSWIPAAG